MAFVPGAGVYQRPLPQNAHLRQYSAVEIAQDILQWAYQKITRFCEMVISQLQNYCTDGAFWFFRTAEIVNPPTLLSRIELLWIYARKGWNQFWTDRKEARLIAENRRLLVQNSALQQSVRPLLIANAQATRLADECERLCQENQFLRQDRTAILAVRDALMEEKRALSQMIASFTSRPLPTDGWTALQSCLSIEQSKWLTQYMAVSEQPKSP